MASHLNRLHEAILMNDTMYSLIEFKKKLLHIYIKFSLLSGAMNAKIKMRLYVIFSKPRKCDTADIKIKRRRGRMVRAARLWCR